MKYKCYNQMDSTELRQTIYHIIFCELTIDTSITKYLSIGFWPKTNVCSFDPNDDWDLHYIERNY